MVYESQIQFQLIYTELHHPFFRLRFVVVAFLIRFGFLQKKSRRSLSFQFESSFNDHEKKNKARIDSNFFPCVSLMQNYLATHQQMSETPNETVQTGMFLILVEII